jgi:hypothetical protein
MIKQLIGYMLLSSVVLATAGPERAAVAPPPPMGWNSFDAWDCRITERQFKANVDFMARELKSYGWEYAADNRQVFRDEEHAVWIATDPATGDRYLALFNLVDDIRDVTIEFEREMLRGRFRVRDLWKREDVGVVEESLTRKLGAHDAAPFWLSPAGR